MPLKQKSNQHPFIKNIVKLTQNDVEFYVVFDILKYNFFRDYEFIGFNVLPGAFVIETFLACQNSLSLSKNFSLSNLKICKPIFFKNKEQLDFKVIYLKKSQEFRMSQMIKDTGEMCLHATVSLIDRKNIHVNFDKLPQAQKIDLTKFYISAKKIGLNYGESYRWIKNFTVHKNIAHVVVPPNHGEPEFRHPPNLIYGGFQIMSVLLSQISYEYTSIYLPAGISNIVSHHGCLNLPVGSIWVILNKDAVTGNYSFDIHLTTSDRQPILSILEFKIIAIKQSDLKNNLNLKNKEWVTNDISTHLVKLNKILLAYIEKGLESFSVFDHFCFLLVIVFAKQFGLLTSVIKIPVASQ